MLHAAGICGFWAKVVNVEPDDGRTAAPYSDEIRLCMPLEECGSSFSRDGILEPSVPSDLSVAPIGEASYLFDDRCFESVEEEMIFVSQCHH